MTGLRAGGNATGANTSPATASPAGMSSLPAAAFAVLVAATIGAFFITQHLKVSTPLLAGTPAPFPAAINPIDGVTCYQPATHRYVDHRIMGISFYLLNRSDTVDVYVVDSTGKLVATLARGRHMQGGSHPVRSFFTWNGRESGGAVAPDGRYYVRVRLSGQRRTVTISNTSGPEPVTVKTAPPRPVVTSVTPRFVSRGRLTPVTVAFTGNEKLAVTVIVYRIGRRVYRIGDRAYQVGHRAQRIGGRVHAGGLAHRTGGPVRLTKVKSFLTAGTPERAGWDGLIRERPAPAGSYLIGVQATDAACNTGSFPTDPHPPLQTVSQAIVTVRP